MKRLIVMLLVLAFAAPLWAVRVKLKAEDRDFEAEIVQLEGDTVTYKKGRREHTAKLDDFEPESQFAIKDERTGDSGAELMELARFALHRGLYKHAQDTAAKAAKLDGFKDQAGRLSNIAFNLEADALLEKAVKLLDVKDVKAAEPVLQDVNTRFPGTSAALKADILLGTLKRVELEAKAAELEAEAKKAQAEADADEQKRRAPIDDWLSELDSQVDSNDKTKMEADKQCASDDLNRGLAKYKEVVAALKKIRDNLKKNRSLFKYRGENGVADKIDNKARRLIIESYYNWASNLYRTQQYATAAEICNKGISMDPKDRRFLSLKVDIDEYYDPLTDR